MLAFSLQAEQRFDPRRHVEKVLGRVGDGDVTIACWEPGQISPYHCHPNATEIYFCFEGGGTMRTPEDSLEVRPGAFVVHPPGELHEFANGPQCTLLFRVRYGATEIQTRTIAWRGQPDWRPRPEDQAYLEAHPLPV
jgi:quercetin dioxygenase-like cupin family protein